MSGDELERLAVEELLKEAKRGAERAKDLGASGWVKPPVASTNKRFLTNTILSTIPSQPRKRQILLSSEEDRREQGCRKNDYYKERDRHRCSYSGSPDRSNKRIKYSPEYSSKKHRKKGKKHSSHRKSQKDSLLKRSRSPSKTYDEKTDNKCVSSEDKSKTISEGKKVSQIEKTNKNDKDSLDKRKDCDSQNGLSEKCPALSEVKEKLSTNEYETEITAENSNSGEKQKECDGLQNLEDEKNNLSIACGFSSAIKKTGEKIYIDSAKKGASPMKQSINKETKTEHEKLSMAHRTVSIKSEKNLKECLVASQIFNMKSYEAVNHEHPASGTDDDQKVRSSSESPSKIQGDLQQLGRNKNIEKHQRKSGKHKKKKHKKYSKKKKSWNNNR